MDLGLKYVPSSSGSQSTIMRRAYELGWECVAWNTIVTGRSGLLSHSSSPVLKDLSGVEMAQLDVNRRLSYAIDTDAQAHIRQLSRITMMVDDVVDAQVLSTGNDMLSSYDIVAASPGNGSVFAYLCKSADIDIISINFGVKIPFALNKKLMDAAVSRGIQFEICYSQAVQSALVRKRLVSGTKTLIQFLKGKNVIITSGADAYQTIRGPKDVENIASMFHLTQEQAHAAISINCQRLLQRSAARKMRNIPIEIKDSLNDIAHYNSNNTQSRRTVNIGSSTERKKRGVQEIKGDKPEELKNAIKAAIPIDDDVEDSSSYEEDVDDDESTPSAPKKAKATAERDEEDNDDDGFLSF